MRQQVGARVDPAPEVEVCLLLERAEQDAEGLAPLVVAEVVQPRVVDGGSQQQIGADAALAVPWWLLAIVAGAVLGVVACCVGLWCLWCRLMQAGRDFRHDGWRVLDVLNCKYTQHSALRAL